MMQRFLRHLHKCANFVDAIDADRACWKAITVGRRRRPSLLSSIGAKFYLDEFEIIRRRFSEEGHHRLADPPAIRLAEGRLTRRMASA